MWLPLIHRMASVENGNVLWLLFLHFHKSLSFERKKMYKFDMKFIILVMLHFTFYIQHIYSSEIMHSYFTYYYLSIRFWKCLSFSVNKIIIEHVLFDIL